MTWSILALCPETGNLGVAAASRFFALGALVPHLRGGKCAVATQAFVSPLWGIETADRTAAGEDAATVLADLVARDPGSPNRQLHVITGSGARAAHTGAACVDWAGDIGGPGLSVAGNMLAGPQVLEATRAAFLRATGPLAERLLAAMEAGEAAGGDKRGRQSAVLRIHRVDDYPWIDLRVDDHGAPLHELRRLWTVAQERYLHFADAMPTRANPSGALDRAPLDRAIAAAEAAARAAGRPSASCATPLPPPESATR